MSFYVGIAGYKRSGKDTVAKILIEELENVNVHAIRRALADALKEECASMMSREINRAAELYADKYDFEVPSKEEFFTRMNSDEYKETYRLLMQFWGTEWARQHIRDDYWLRAVEDYIESMDANVAIIPDVRFPNEVTFCHEHGGIVVNVVRPGATTSGHSSENALDGCNEFNAMLDNSSDIDYLRQQIKENVVPIIMDGVNNGK